MIDIFRWILVALSLPLLVMFVLHIIKRARALSERIDEYHQEQDDEKNQPGPINPYADMAKLFGAEPDQEHKQE